MWRAVSWFKSTVRHCNHDKLHSFQQGTGIQWKSHSMWCHFINHVLVRHCIQAVGLILSLTSQIAAKTLSTVV